MKLHATVILECNAHDVSEAGERLNEPLAYAAEHQLGTRSFELATPPGSSVTLPSMPTRSIGAMTL